jgi:hypothetical protein
MEMKQVSENCFAVLNEKNRVCDANSGLINRGGGVAKRIEFRPSREWRAPPGYS